jgi:hypothetical protein
MRSAKEHASLAEAIRHPLRVRILEVVNEREMAPVDFVKGGYADFYFGHRPDVSHIAYHFRELADFGCLEPVAWRKARGSVATTYRGTARGEVGEEAWAELPEDEKRAIARASAQGLFARIDGAFMADTFLRPGHLLSWAALQLDERGWEDIGDILALACYSLGAVAQDSRERLVEAGEKGLTATAAIFLFGSPDPTAPVEILEEAE